MRAAWPGPLCQVTLEQLVTLPRWTPLPLSSPAGSPPPSFPPSASSPTHPWRSPWHPFPAQSSRHARTNLRHVIAESWDPCWPHFEQVLRARGCPGQPRAEAGGHVHGLRTLEGSCVRRCWPRWARGWGWWGGSGEQGPAASFLGPLSVWDTQLLPRPRWPVHTDSPAPLTQMQPIPWVSGDEAGIFPKEFCCETVGKTRKRALGACCRECLEPSLSLGGRACPWDDVAAQGWVSEVRAWGGPSGSFPSHLQSR